MCWINATVTLAGVVGIVVSIGISLDSSIVFFETIKEDVRNGAGLRPSVDKAFGSAYATIVKADMSSLIGAGVLYWLSVGPVRGFAFYLGVATILDLVSAYFFLRPAALVLARSRQGEHPRRFGIPTDDLPAAKRFGYGGVERNQIKTISGVYAIQSVTKQKGQMGRVAAGQGTGGFDASDIAVGSVDRQPQASGAALGFGELLAECCAKAR